MLKVMGSIHIFTLLFPKIFLYVNMSFFICIGFVCVSGCSLGKLWIYLAAYFHVHCSTVGGALGVSSAWQKNLHTGWESTHLLCKTATPAWSHPAWETLVHQLTETLWAFWGNYKNFNGFNFKILGVDPGCINHNSLSCRFFYIPHF